MSASVESPPPPRFQVNGVATSLGSSADTESGWKHPEVTRGTSTDGRGADLIVQVSCNRPPAVAVACEHVFCEVAPQLRLTGDSVPCGSSVIAWPAREVRYSASCPLVGR